jgi:indoleamine 2,3-dioxygenase
MAELLVSLESYDISPQLGFLPSLPSLEQLPNPYYEPWERATSNLPRLISERSLRQLVHGMPVLSTEFLVTEVEWRRAYVILAYISNGFLFQSCPPPEVILIPNSLHLGL